MKYLILLLILSGCSSMEYYHWGRDAAATVELEQAELNCDAEASKQFHAVNGQYDFIEETRYNHFMAKCMKGYGYEQIPNERESYK